MSEAVVLVRKIVTCPECIKKGRDRRYELSPHGIKSLNNHLLVTHGSNYKIIIAENSAVFMPRSKKA